jgi:hypothetical protein
MRGHLLRHLIAAGVWLAAASPTAGAATTPEAAQLFKQLDTNADTVLDQSELTTALTPSLREVANLQHLGDPGGLVLRVVTRALNSIRRDDVRVEDMDAFLAYRLDPPFPLSLRALLLQQDAPATPGGAGPRWPRWVELRQSAIDESAIGKPATFSYASRDSGDESRPTDPVSQWQVNAAVIFNSQRDVAAGRWRLTPLAAYEVQINSDKVTDDRIIHRVGVLGSLTPQSNWIDSHYLFATFDYTTDRRYDARIFGTTVEYSPTVSRWAIGASTPGTNLRFRWRPYAGLVYGHVADAGALTELDDDYTNLTLRVTPELRLFGRLTLAPLLEWAQQLEGEKQAHGYYEWAARVVVLDSDRGEASLELSYNTGRQSPAFHQTGVFTAALAIKF